MLRARRAVGSRILLESNMMSREIPRKWNGRSWDFSKSHHKKNGVDWDFEKWKYLEDVSSKP